MEQGASKPQGGHSIQGGKGRQSSSRGNIQKEPGAMGIGMCGKQGMNQVTTWSVPFGCEDFGDAVPHTVELA